MVGYRRLSFLWMLAEAHNWTRDLHTKPHTREEMQETHVCGVAFAYLFGSVCDTPSLPRDGDGNVARHTRTGRSRESARSLSGDSAVAPSGGD